MQWNRLALWITEATAPLAQWSVKLAHRALHETHADWKSAKRNEHAWNQIQCSNKLETGNIKLKSSMWRAALFESPFCTHQPELRLSAKTTHATCFKAPTALRLQQWLSKNIQNQTLPARHQSRFDCSQWVTIESMALYCTVTRLAPPGPCPEVHSPARRFPAS